MGLDSTPAAAARAARREHADLVILNGDVLVMNERFTQTQALAVRDGRIIAHGSNREIQRLADRRTEMVGAQGGTVLPGINDSHLHLSAFALTVPHSRTT